MRISAKPSDVDFYRRKTAGRPIVLLNGKPVGFVVEAQDGASGYVRVEVQGSDGKPVLASVVAPDGGVLEKIIATRKLRGNVRIIMAEKVG